MSRTIGNGALSEDRLFVTEAPDIDVSLPYGRSVNLRDQTLTLVGQLEEAFDAVDERRTQVRQDSSLTDQGKRDRLRELDRLLAEKIRSMAKDLPVAELEERADDLERQLSALRPRLSPEDEELAYDLSEKAREARQVIRGMDSNERNELLMRAAREDDRAVLLAFEDSPLPPVSEGEIEQAREVHVRTRYPERVEKVDAIRTGISRLRGNANMAMGMLAERSGNPEFELRPFPGSGRAEAAQEAEAALAEA